MNLLPPSSGQESQARKTVGIYGRAVAWSKLMETAGPYAGSLASVGFIMLITFSEK